MAGTGVKVRVRVPREGVLELEVVGGYRHGAKVMVVYRHGGTATGGRFVFRLRHARGVQLWEGDESHHLLAADIARFDALAPGSKFVLGRIPWTKMSESDLRRVLGNGVLHNRR